MDYNDLVYKIAFDDLNKHPFSLRARTHMRLHHQDDKHAATIAQFKAVDGSIPARLGLSKEMVTPDTPVCIIGAGVAGLYTAMIFQSLGIPFELIEQSNRVGGRLFTYKFENQTDEYQYYDVGAMRFPKTKFMNRTFDIVEKVNQIIPNRLTWIDYYFQSIGPTQVLQYCSNMTYYNGRRIRNGEPNNVADIPDPFHVNDHQPPYIPDDHLDLLRPAQLEGQLAQIMNVLKADFRDPTMTMEEAMHRLVLEHDKDSMRSYLTNNPQYAYPSSVIHLLETFDKSTGWYDRALVESVCESLAFEWTETTGDIKYYCFDGGSSKLPEGMHDCLKKKAEMNIRVSSIEYVPIEGPGGLVVKGYKLDPATGKEAAYEKEFAAVVSTVPLAALNLIDLSNCGINDNYAQYSGIRELQYGPSIKIGIQFNENWWENLGIIGGQSFTDLPIRTVVYPSYPPGADVSKSRVLIASYCWTQDAERLGALIDNTTGKLSMILQDLVLRNLEKIHELPTGSLDTMVVDSFAFDWLHNPMTQGAFAFFGPQEFGDQIYTQMRQPAARGQLFFAGEATSGCHAWVAGALDSAWHSVWQFLTAYRYPQTVMDDFTRMWGDSEYWDDHAQLHDHFTLGLAQMGMTPEGTWIPPDNHAGQHRAAAVQRRGHTCHACALVHVLRLLDTLIDHEEIEGWGKILSIMRCKASSSPRSED